MSKTDIKDLPYRPAAGIMLMNAEGKIFVGQRIDAKLEAWQMPQGGIDDGEEPDAAALRELWEETGVRADLVEIVAKSPEPLYYDLPPELVGKVWKGRYRGQRQIWYLMRFLGTDADVAIETEHPEFRSWTWAEPRDLPELIVPFKKALYEDVLRVFADHLDL